MNDNVKIHNHIGSLTVITVLHSNNITTVKEFLGGRGCKSTKSSKGHFEKLNNFLKFNPGNVSKNGKTKLRT